MSELGSTPPGTAAAARAPGPTRADPIAPIGTAHAVAVGDVLPPLSLRVTRSDLVRYAGASGDFNPIHWSDRFASGVGLPGVIAHGMLTMALAGRLVTRWAGDPTAVRSCGVRFTRPVVVPDDDEGALLELSGTVSAVSDATGGVRVATIAITARFDGKTVLGRATAQVAVPAQRPG